MKSKNATEAEAVEKIRAFNRFYTRKLGLLDEGLLHSEFSLTEVRILFELAHRPGLTATDLRSELGLDRGYMSRTLARLTRRGVLHRGASGRDARQQLLKLSTKGAGIFARLNTASSQQVAGWLTHLPPSDRERLTGLLREAEELMRPEKKVPSPVVLREPRSGDYGWVVGRHGALYAAEYQWNATFEGLVAKIISAYVGKHDPATERCWIATQHDAPVGCVFLVRKSPAIAQLRLLLVEPSTRGQGVGRQLVQACVDFARAAGYRKIQLWTNSVLHAARHLYQAAGFQLVAAEKHHSFGHDLTGQTWELVLPKKPNSP